MPVYVSTMGELERVLMDALSNAMLDTTVKAENTMKDNIQKEVYNTYTPNHYQRTFEFLNSVNSKVDINGLLISSEIYSDPNKLKAVAPYDGNNHIGQHYSTYKYSPPEYTQYLAETINSGIRSGQKKVFGDGVYSRARPYFDKSDAAIKSTFRNDLIKGMKKQGVRNVV